MSHYTVTIHIHRTNTVAKPHNSDLMSYTLPGGGLLDEIRLKTSFAHLTSQWDARPFHYQPMLRTGGEILLRTWRCNEGEAPRRGDRRPSVASADAVITGVFGFQSMRRLL
jgi:hypothetical protein